MTLTSYRLRYLAPSHTSAGWLAKTMPGAA